MPLADHGCLIAVVPQERSEGHPAVFNQAGKVCPHDASFQLRPPGVSTGQQSVARGSAHGVRAVPIGEGHALLDEAIEVGGLELRFRIEGGDIPVSLVIGIDQDDVGSLCLRTKEPKREHGQEGAGQGDRRENLGVLRDHRLIAGICFLRGKINGIIRSRGCRFQVFFQAVLQFCPDAQRPDRTTQVPRTGPEPIR